jgi:hypothetical protein
MTAAIRFTVVWPIMAGKLRQIAKETKECRSFGTIGFIISPAFLFLSPRREN